MSLIYPPQDERPLYYFDEELPLPTAEQLVALRQALPRGCGRIEWSEMPLDPDRLNRVERQITEDFEAQFWGPEPLDPQSKALRAIEEP